jgi:hypothetical protein
VAHQLYPSITGMSFVGSTTVATCIYSRAAAHGKSGQAAGGARSVIVIMPDVVLDKTVPNVIHPAFRSSGQRCLAGSVLMPTGEAHEPVRLLVEAVAESKVGNLHPSGSVSQVMQGFDFSRSLNGPDHEGDHRPPARRACLCTVEGACPPGAPDGFDGSRSEDQVEGMSAFLEKREARFTGY